MLLLSKQSPESESSKLNLQECYRLYKPARENCSISALDAYPELGPNITNQYCQYLNSAQLCTVQAVCSACSTVSALHVYPHLYDLLKKDMRRADCAGHFFEEYAAVYGNFSHFVNNFVCSKAVRIVPQLVSIYLLLFLFYSHMFLF